MAEIFISHSSKNMEFVQKLGSELECSRHKVWIAAVDIQAGQNILAEIEDHIEKCDYLILVLSKDAIKSNWVKMEWRIKYFDDISKEKDTIIPVLLEKCELPASLRGTRLIDFSGDYQVALNELKRAISPSRKPINHAERNHLLISTQSPYNSAIRSKLLDWKEDLRIEVDTFNQEEEYKCRDYICGIEKFLNDDNSKLLFTVHPTDEKSKFTEDEELNWVTRLQEKGKKIVFFNSGDNFRKYVCNKPEMSPIISIEPRYKQATKILVNHIITEIIKPPQGIHFITILGPPKSHAANQRRAIYNEFLSSIFLKRDMDYCPELIPELMIDGKKSEEDWNVLLRELCHLETVQINTLRIANWRRNRAKEIIQKFYQTLSIDNQALHHCFLCGNDDIALGVREAIMEKADSELVLPNCSFIGFDGISEMEECLKHGLNGATMKVNLDDAVEFAKLIVEGNVGRHIYPIGADLIVSGQREAE